MKKVFISWPGQKDYQILKESDKEEKIFTFASFDGSKKLDFPVEITHDPSLPPLRPISLRNQNFSDKEEYEKLIENAIAFIKHKKLGKIVISRRQAVSKTIEPLTLFKRLVNAYPAACVYLMVHPAAGCWIGATPELLLNSKNHTLSTMSLAGTRTRDAKNPFTPKEEEEQKLVTDFIYSLFKGEKHLTKVWKGQPQLHQAGNLVHFKTEISAQLLHDFALTSFLHKLHPTPAVAGYPRPSALDFIKQHEGYDRSFYSGYLGVSESGSCKYFVNLRCMEVFDNTLILYAGGGITAQSVASAEWEETEAKMQTLLSVIES